MAAHINPWPHIDAVKKIIIYQRPLVNPTNKVFNVTYYLIGPSLGLLFQTIPQKVRLKLCRYGKSKS